MTIMIVLLLVSADQSADCDEPIELVFRSSREWPNPFTDVELSADFRHESGHRLSIDGFFDGNGAGEQAGRQFTLRFCADKPGRWAYRTQSNDPSLSGQTGTITCRASARTGPVIVDGARPRHFVYRNTDESFVHLGFTAYHLLDPSNDDATIRKTIDYCAQNGFNKIRFLIAGYPRDADRRQPGEFKGEFGVGPERARMVNYGAPPGELNPLPVWLGQPHQYDFARFHLAYWHKLERAIRGMRAKGIVACCIFTIEKQDLPDEYGALTDHEKRFYRYGVARLAAFDNVWWDLGNEHNEYRKRDWAPAMGRLVKQWDPYDRLLSVHGYARWEYGNAGWADFVMTQQYGTPSETNSWVLQYRSIPKPYVNEEYGYEGRGSRSGHEQNADIVRRCHWSIAMAGGYATYGDSGKRAGYYIGEPDAGVAALQLKHLRSFFERLGRHTLEPDNGRLADGFCMTDGKRHLIGYLPEGKTTAVDLRGLVGPVSLEWFDPRGGERIPDKLVSKGQAASLTPPSTADWAFQLALQDAADNQRRSR